MSEALFKNLDRNNDPLWVGKEFFNSINDMFFLYSIGCLVEGISYVSEYSGCEFSHNLEEDEEPFEGVCFRFLDDEVVVTEELFKKCLILACHRYGELHPDKTAEIENLLSRLQ